MEYNGWEMNDAERKRRKKGNMKKDDFSIGVACGKLQKLRSVVCVCVLVHFTHIRLCLP